MKSTLSNYANAFFTLAIESDKLDIYYEDAMAIQQTFSYNKQLEKILSNYLLDEKERIDIIDKVFSFLKEENSRNFLKVVLSNHKLKYIDEIIDIFHDMYNDKMNISKGIIYSSISLSKEQIKKIELAFLKKKNQKVELTNRIDQNLIGGIKVVIKDRVYDGSIKNQLERLKHNLKREGDNL